MVKPNSIDARTNPAISCSVSGVSTTNGYSTRQSVASVTCDTRDKPSNLMLPLLVCLAKTLRALARRSYMFLNCCAKSATAARALLTNCSTLAARMRASSESCALKSKLRRLSISLSRWFKASTKAARRLGLSSKSSCKYGLRLTTQTSPKTSYNIFAERPVRRSPRSSRISCHAPSPNKRMMISRSEKEV